MGLFLARGFEATNPKNFYFMIGFDPVRRFTEMKGNHKPENNQTNRKSNHNENNQNNQLNSSNSLDDGSVDPRGERGESTFQRYLGSQ
jgi:hypothetical protein